MQIVFHLREVGERGRDLAAVVRLTCKLAQVLGRVRRERQQAVIRGIHYALELLRGERHLFPLILGTPAPWALQLLGHHANSVDVLEHWRCIVVVILACAVVCLLHSFLSL